MIFRLYSKIAIKADGERYVFDRSQIMFKDMIEIENASGYAYLEWEEALGRGSIRAIAAAVHMLRKKNGEPSDFDTMNFPVSGFDIVPLHDDGTEFTAQEVAADITRRLEEPEDPTNAAGSGNGGPSPDTGNTSLTSPPSTASARGNGTGSPGRSSKGSKKQPTKH